MSSGDITENIQLFYNITSIPVQIFTEEKPIYEVPRQVRTVSDIINHPKTVFRNEAATSDLSPIYIKTEFEECYIVIGLTCGLCAVAGPFLLENIPDNYAQNLIKSKGIPEKLKNKLFRHYRSLPVVPSNTSYYYGQLFTLIIRMCGFEESQGSRGQMAVLEQKEQNTGDEPEDMVNLDDYYSQLLENRTEYFVHPPYSLELELVKKIKNGDGRKARRLLEEINSMKKAELSIEPLRSLKNSLIGSATFFTRALIEGGVNPDDAFTLSDTSILEIERILNFTQLQEYEYVMLDRFVDLAIEHSSRKYSNVINFAINYINSNIINKISVQEIARQVFLHPNYLSALFKKEVGMSVSDFILRRKIEESAFHLKHSTSTITDISSFYHFCNQSYYTKLFKKYYGVSPREYRLNPGILD